MDYQFLFSVYNTFGNFTCSMYVDARLDSEKQLCSGLRSQCLIPHISAILPSFLSYFCAPNSRTDSWASRCVRDCNTASHSLLLWLYSPFKTRTYPQTSTLGSHASDMRCNSSAYNPLVLIRWNTDYVDSPANMVGLKAK